MHICSILVTKHPLNSASPPAPVPTSASILDAQFELLHLNRTDGAIQDGVPIQHNPWDCAPNYDLYDDSSSMLPRISGIALHRSLVDCPSRSATAVCPFPGTLPFFFDVQPHTFRRWTCDLDVCQDLNVLGPMVKYPRMKPARTKPTRATRATELFCSTTAVRYVPNRDFCGLWFGPRQLDV